MTLFRVNRPGIFKRQKHLIESEFLRRVPFFECSTSPALTEQSLEESPQRKVLKVAIVGRPNAGKSTLINCLLNLNLCGVSCKTHTTQNPFRAALTRGNTQIVLVDTPGLVTQKEFARFNLSDAFLTWKKNVLQQADIIGVVHEAYRPRSMFKFHLNLTQNIREFPKSKPLFLVLSKIDLVLDKEYLSSVMSRMSSPDASEELKELPGVMEKFSKIFFTSSTKGTGINELAEYLLGQAKPGNWLFGPGKVFHVPLHHLILDILRSKFLNTFPNVIPYSCKYEVEYLQENELGEILCVALVTCEKSFQAKYIVSGKKLSLRDLSKEIESDLYYILKKVFRIRVVVQSKEVKVSK